MNGPLLIAVGVLLLVVLCLGGYVFQLRDQRDDCRAAAVFWMNSSRRKDADRLADAREIALLRDWIKRQWGKTTIDSGKTPTNPHGMKP